MQTELFESNFMATISDSILSLRIAFRMINFSKLFIKSIFSLFDISIQKLSNVSFYSLKGKYHKNN